MSERAKKAANLVKEYNIGEKADKSPIPTHVRFTKGQYVHTRGRWLDLNDPSAIDEYAKLHPDLHGDIEIKIKEGIIFGFNECFEHVYTIFPRGTRKKSLKICYV